MTWNEDKPYLPETLQRGFQVSKDLAVLVSLSLY